MICECGAVFNRLHPDLNICRCGMSYDGEGNSIELDSASLQPKPANVPVEDVHNLNEGYHNKPGSALESLIPDWVVQFKKGCGCKDYSKKMDRWGTDGCIAREKEIVGHLMGQSDKLIPIFRGIPKSLREAAAKKLLAKAIEISRKV